MSDYNYTATCPYKDEACRSGHCTNCRQLATPRKATMTQPEFTSGQDVTAVVRGTVSEYTDRGDYMKVTEKDLVIASSVGRLHVVSKAGANVTVNRPELQVGSVLRALTANGDEALFVVMSSIVNDDRKRILRATANKMPNIQYTVEGFWLEFPVATVVFNPES